MTEDEALGALIRRLARRSAAEQAAVFKGLSQTDQRALSENWPSQTHGGQDEPDGNWRNWLMMAGRGFGKTRTGAEWVLAKARANPKSRIALVGGSVDDVTKVMVEGESGLLGCARIEDRLVWRASTGKLRLPQGGLAIAYSGANPGRLRGPQHHFAWADELAKWARPEETWSNLQLGLRLGDRAQALVTTTPGPLPLLSRLIADPATETTGGRTIDNPNLPAGFVAAMLAAYGGTRLGRQELDGELLGEAEGALWTREMIEACRRPMPRRDELGRVIVAVDPPATAAGDACGIVVCGKLGDGRALVLADCSVARLRPLGWAARVAAAASAWDADRVIAEANNGGEMVEDIMRTVAPDLPIRLVHAARGKGARAEPVAALFEAHRCMFAGAFPDLEDELTAITADAAGSRSPDRADAMVWALTELVLRAPAEPRIRSV
ncbi:MAG TPA: terminase family protein [Sphingomicrobium sp.]